MEKLTLLTVVMDKEKWSENSEQFKTVFNSFPKDSYVVLADGVFLIKQKDTFSMFQDFITLLRAVGLNFVYVPLNDPNSLYLSQPVTPSTNWGVEFHTYSTK